MKPTKTALAALVASSLAAAAGIATAVELPERTSGAASAQADDTTTTTAGGESRDTTDDGEDPTTTTEPEDTTDNVDVADGGDEASDGDSGRPVDTHGFEVSTFARTSALEGREKGQAIAELARTNGEAGDDTTDDDTTDEDGQGTASARSSR